MTRRLTDTRMSLVDVAQLLELPSRWVAAVLLILWIAPVRFAAMGHRSASMSGTNLVAPPDRSFASGYRPPLEPRHAT